VIIRSASFRDLARIEQLYREATEDERHGAQMTLDSPVPQATLLRLWQALTKSLSSLVPITDVSEEMLVAEDAKEGVVGFVQVQSLSVRPRSWQILNLCTSTTAHGHFARAELLDGVRNRGLELGVQRVHVRLPVDHALLPVFLEHGFTQFATEQILYRDQASADPEPSVNATLIRPARRDDIGAIYLLYLRTTPSHVADVEGPARSGAAFPSAPLPGESGVMNLPLSIGGIWIDTSSPSGFGSLSSNSGRMTAAASASTIAPTSRRRARRLSSSTAGSAASGRVSMHSWELSQRGDPSTPAPRPPSETSRKQ